MVSAEQVEPGPLEVGTHWRGTTKVMGRRFEWTVETTQLEHLARLTSRSVGGPMNSAGRRC